MKTESAEPRAGSELRSFVLFYGSAAATAIVVRAIASLILPPDLLADHNGFLWTLSFLIGCAICAWALERNHRLAARRMSRYGLERGLKDSASK